ATERCLSEEPQPREIAPGRVAACHYPEKAEEFRLAASDNRTWQQVAERLAGVSTAPAAVTQKHEATGDTLLEVRELVRHFPAPRNRHVKGRAVVHAVDGISFEVQAGEILGLAG